MEQLKKQAKGLQTKLIDYRERIHQNAETGFAVQKTVDIIQSELQKIGYAPKRTQNNILTATIGQGEHTFLLRAETDALPIKEKTKLPFACKNGCMHACGHDMHMAMLLGAAILLKQREKQLKCRIKLLFQPAEEILQGGAECIKKGIVDGVSGAFSLHVLTGVDLPTGQVIVTQGTSAPSADYFHIQIQGKSCHGGMPWQGVDSLTTSARILLGLQELSAREIPPQSHAVLTVGSMQSGDTGNAISGKVDMQGTLRAYDEETRARIKKRIQEIAQNIAKAFHAKAKITFNGGCPALLNNAKLCDMATQIVENAFGEGAVLQNAGGEGGGSEDFAYIAQKVPSVMVALCAGNKKDGYAYPLHHEKAVFDESVLWKGAFLYAAMAIKKV